MMGGLRVLLTEPARPDAIRNSPRAMWLAVACVCVGAFMGQLDASIVTLATRSLQHDFSVPLASVEWVALIYLLVLVGTVSAVGRISDMAGRKLVYTYGFGVFTLASLGCGLAPNLDVLLVMRAIQAVGAAMLQANSVALIRVSVGPENLQRAIGVQGAAQALGLSLGPAVGGALIALGGWRLVFLVNLPAGIIGIVLAWFLLPRTHQKAEAAPIDWRGLAALVTGTATLLLAISNAARTGALKIVTIFACIAAAALSAFVAIERRMRSPLIDLQLFADGHFRAGIGGGALAYLVLFGTLFIAPLHLQSAYGLPALRAGFILTVLPLALGIVAPFASSAARRIGTGVVSFIGMLLAAIAMVLASQAGASESAFAAILALAGVGMGLYIPLNNAAVASAGHVTQAGMVSGVLNMTRGFGTALGVAVATATFGHFGFPITMDVLAGAAIIAAALAVRSNGRKTPLSKPVV
jgi:EmrB/QacA subfamily drug resistance transporter